MDTNKKHIVIEKKHIVIPKIIQQLNQISEKSIICKNKTLRLINPGKGDSRLFFSPTIDKKVESYTQEYQAILNKWWDSNSKLWNITINPDYKAKTHVCAARWGDLNIKQTFSKLRKVILKTLNTAIYASYIKSFIIFYELGDKNGKPHCNLCINSFPDTPDKVQHIILDTLKKHVGRTKFSTNLKDQRKLSEPDYYNSKDASFMYQSMRVKPNRYNNLLRKI